MVPKVHDRGIINSPFQKHTNTFSFSDTQVLETKVFRNEERIKKAWTKLM